MKVSDLGEFGLIDILAKIASASQDNRTPSWQKLLIGIGDDTAAWHGDASTKLATVDSLIQNVHFSLGIIPWYELGWKALAANLSDIAAMGGLPRYALVALTLPSHTEVEDVTSLYEGMAELAQQTEVAIVGGDISDASLVTITITVFGSTRNRSKRILTRSAAEPGELVAVSGSLGAAAGGLEMLTQRLQFNARATEYLKKAFLHPYPRITEGELLVDKGIKTAIDISDGLISDLNQICRASQVSARIEIDRVPIEPIVKANFGDKALTLALSGGEDYELLFTGSAKTIANVQKATSRPITVIGEITADTTHVATIVDSSGNTVATSKTGWEHFTTVL